MPKIENYEEVKIEDVQDGDVIRLPGENLPPEVQGNFNMKIAVYNIEPSVQVEGSYVLTNSKKRGRRFRIPGDLVVRKIVPPKKEVKVPKPTCECRSHLGKYKRRFHTRNAALRVAMKFYRKHGMQAVYECPTVAGVFHVTTQDQAKFRVLG